MLDPRIYRAGLIVVAVTVIIAFLKGTSPGGPGAWEEFQAIRDGNRGS